MTVEEPRYVEVALYPDQVDRLERAVAANPADDDADQLLRLLVADHTDTLEHLRPPTGLDVERVRRLLDRPRVVLDDLVEVVDGTDPT